MSENGFDIKKKWPILAGIFLTAVVVIIVVIFIVLPSKNNYVGIIKNSKMESGITVEQLLSGYKYTKNIRWDTYKGKIGRFVEAKIRLKCSLLHDLENYKPPTGIFS